MFLECFEVIWRRQVSHLTTSPENLIAKAQGLGSLLWGYNEVYELRFVQPVLPSPETHHIISQTPVGRTASSAVFQYSSQNLCFRAMDKHA